MIAETYFQLLRDPAHWLFELTLVVLFDGLLGILVWPRIRDHFHRDVRATTGRPAPDARPHVPPGHGTNAPAALWPTAGSHRRV